MVLLQNCGNIPILTAHHQGSPRLEASYWLLVVRYYCSYKGALFFSFVFFLCENDLCVYLITALCSVFAE